MSDAKPAGETTTTKLSDGGPAFPNPDTPHTAPGMSLRDWFAGQALAGIIASGRPVSSRDAASDARIYADAVLAELEGGAQ